MEQKPQMCVSETETEQLCLKEANWKFFKLTSLTFNILDDLDIWLDSVIVLTRFFL